MTAQRQPAGRPCHVFDYDGEYLGSFTTWSAAHEWAHLQAALGGVPGPLEVEDHRARQRHRIWADHCEPLTGPPLAADAAAGPSTDGTAWAPGAAGAVTEGGGPAARYPGLIDQPTACGVLDASAFNPPRPRRPS